MLSTYCTPNGGLGGQKNVCWKNKKWNKIKHCALSSSVSKTLSWRERVSYHRLWIAPKQANVVLHTVHWADAVRVMELCPFFSLISRGLMWMGLIHFIPHLICSTSTLVGILFDWCYFIDCKEQWEVIDTCDIGQTPPCMLAKVQEPTTNQYSGYYFIFFYQHLSLSLSLSLLWFM